MSKGSKKQNNKTVVSNEATTIDHTTEMRTPEGHIINKEMPNDSTVKQALFTSLPKGRPTDPESARQKKLAEMAERKANGELHRGRPVDPTSARQQKLANKGEGKVGIKTGRPVDMNSKRQQQIAERAVKLAQLNAAVSKMSNPASAEFVPAEA